MKLPELSQPCRGIPKLREDEPALYESTTDALARARAQDSQVAQIPLPASIQKRDDQSLFRDPTMTAPVDFGWGEGFTQAAKKKNNKKAAAAWEDTPAEKDEGKKDEGDANNGDSNGGDKAAGDNGTGASGDGDDKKDGGGDDAKKDEPEDEWASFAPAKGKKKGKKGKVEEVIAAPDPPPAADIDAFQDVSLDAPSIDMSFGDSSVKSPTFGDWGNQWSTGKSGKTSTSK